VFSILGYEMSLLSVALVEFSFNIYIYDALLVYINFLAGERGPRVV